MTNMIFTNPIFFITLPMHFDPTNVNPFLQEQVKPPRVLRQRPLVFSSGPDLAADM